MEFGPNKADIIMGQIRIPCEEIGQSYGLPIIISRARGTAWQLGHRGELWCRQQLEHRGSCGGASWSTGGSCGARMLPSEGEPMPHHVLTCDISGSAIAIWRT